ncbi:MAG: dTMP kinase [Candidatus Micrarchaeota archaeon]|nr:dTMP kinase [Candidatus Micrarchaeota archaeon]
MLIVFEGIDGSGKGGQIRRLLSFFRQNGIKHRLHKYPTRRANEAFAHLRGEKDVAPGRLADIFADDILGERKKIEREIASGAVVVCDRYLHSTLAYQGVGMGFARLRRKLSGIDALAPDIVILLDVPARLSGERKRKQKTPDRFEKDGMFLEKVRANYLREAREGFLAYKYAVVDASRAKGEVFSDVVLHVEPLVVKRMGR